MRRTMRTGAVIVAAVSALILAGCNSDPEPEETTEETEEETGDEVEAGGLIAVITPAHSNVFFKAEADAAVAMAEELGYETTSNTHDDDPVKESELIDAAIAAGAVAIILDNAGAEESIGNVQKATDAGIPVFLIDREISQDGIAKAQIVSNNAQGAGLVGEAFVEAMGGAGRYIELTGRDTDTNAHVRSDAYAAVISQYPDMVQVAQDTANWDQQEAFEKITALLQADSDIQGIILGNDTMAMGALAAVESAGLTGIIIAGFDGAPDVVQAIRDGKILATGLQPAVLMAQTAVQQADLFIRTGETGQPERQSIDCILVDASNAARVVDFALQD